MTQYRILCGSVAEPDPEPVEPKIFCGAREGAVISYIGSGSGAEIIFLINILLYCRQFGGCQDQDEQKLIRENVERDPKLRDWSCRCRVECSGTVLPELESDPVGVECGREVLPELESDPVGVKCGGDGGEYDQVD